MQLDVAALCANTFGPCFNVSLVGVLATVAAADGKLVDINHDSFPGLLQLQQTNAASCLTYSCFGRDGDLYFSMRIELAGLRKLVFDDGVVHLIGQTPKASSMVLRGQAGDQLRGNLGPMKRPQI